MKIRAGRNIRWLVPICLLASAALMGQKTPINVADQPAAPLEIIPIECAPSGQRGASPGKLFFGCRVSVRNNSGQAVVAFTLAWHWQDASGNTEPGKSYTSRFSVGQETPLLAPGQDSEYAWSFGVPRATASWQVSIDFVLLDQGSAWGQDQSHTLSRLQERLRSRIGTERWILDMLNTGGAETAKQTLEKELAHQPQYTKYMHPSRYVKGQDTPVAKGH